MPTAIEAVDVRKHYPPDVQALAGISLAVEAGTIFGVLGPNGAGKSTMTRVLCSLTRPDSGSATVAGIDVLKHPVQVRRVIGVVGQKHGSDPNATGRENLVLQGEFHGITGRDLKARVASASNASSSRTPPTDKPRPTRVEWHAGWTSPWAC